MNIFLLSKDPVEAASMQCDKHCLKMILETAQMLSTICGGPYKPTHANHPCAIWAKATRNNYAWLVMHGLALCEEYTRRYGKTHKCQAVISSLANKGAELPPGSTEFVQCMPEQFKDADPVVAYRKYYHSKTFAAWNKCTPAPYWWGQYAA